MNKDMLAVIKLILAVVAGLLLFTPVILQNVFIFKDELSGPWIGFWGSFAGGILGTIGVIYVAHLQNKEQARLNDKAIKQQLRDIKEVEDNNKERLKIEIKIGLYKEYIKNVHNIHAKCKKISLLSFKLIVIEESLNEFSGGSKLYETLTEQHKALINEIKEYDNDYFKMLFDEIRFMSRVLKDERSYLQIPLSSNCLENIDDLLNILSSEDVLRVVQLSFEKETITKENYIQKMRELLTSFDELSGWSFAEVSYANRDVGNILKNLNTNKNNPSFGNASD